MTTGGPFGLPVSPPYLGDSNKLATLHEKPLTTSSPLSVSLQVRSLMSVSERYTITTFDRGAMTHTIRVPASRYANAFSSTRSNISVGETTSTARSGGTGEALRRSSGICPIERKAISGLRTRSPTRKPVSAKNTAPS